MLFTFTLLLIFSFKQKQDNNSWIRINQLGYTPDGIKVAVWVSKTNTLPDDFQLMDASSSEVVFTSVNRKIVWQLWAIYPIHAG